MTSREASTSPPAAGRPLRVAIVSKADRTGGGASLIAEKLATLLFDAGHQAEHWTAYAGSHTPPFWRSLHSSGLTRRVIRRLHWTTQGLGLQEFVPAEFLVFWRHLKRYDLVHFHDLSTAISPLTVRLVGRRVPTLWTFHDCSPLTGGCINPRGCEAFHRRCGKCPQLAAWPLKSRCGLDFTGYIQSIKRTTAAADLFAAITPSQWLADEAAKTGMLATPPRVIANGVDCRLFRPREKAAVREMLGMPREGFWALFSAGDLRDSYKGAALAAAALRACGRPVSVLLVGRPSVEGLEPFGDLRKHVAGYVGDQRLLSLYYAAADVVLYPTLADNLPCTVAETMACGVPTIGFRTGGVPEMVEHLQTGWLCDPPGVDGLARGLRLAADHLELCRQWAAAARRRAQQLFDDSLFLRRHLSLYHEILTGHYPGLAHLRGRRLPPEPLGDLRAASALDNGALSEEACDTSSAASYVKRKRAA